MKIAINEFHTAIKQPISGKSNTLIPFGNNKENIIGNRNKLIPYFSNKPVGGNIKKNKFHIPVINKLITYSNK